MANENNEQIKKVSRKNLSDIVPALTRMVSDPDGNFSIFDWGHGQIIGIVQHHQDYPDTAIEDILTEGIQSAWVTNMNQSMKPTSKWTATTVIWSKAW